MNHRSGFNPLERMAASRKALHRSMVTSLFRYERIRTTKAKALAIRRSAEKLITRAKVDSVHNRRLASARLYDEGIVAKLFTDIALRMKERPGGYTRIIKLGQRQGDAAEIVILELVDYKLVIGDTGDKKPKSNTAGKKKSGGGLKEKRGDGKKASKASVKAAAARGKTTSTTRKTAPAAD
jgi:large subunit ribosomal protein L17